MRMRWKFLIVLLGISLVPMFIMRINGQQTMRSLGQDLATHSKNALIIETKIALKRLVEDHARVLKRERELLEMTLSLLSSEIQKRLYYLEDNSFIETEIFFSSGTIALQEHHEKEMYCVLKHQNQCLPMKVDFKKQGIYDLTLTEGKNEDQDISHRLASLLSLNFAIKNKHPELILWQYVIMETGTEMIYPFPGHEYRHRMRSMSPLPDWYLAAKEKRHINWSHPTLDPITGGIVFFVSAPFYDLEGNFTGASALAVPLTVFLHENKHIRMLSDHVISLLVEPEHSAERPIRIIAQESAHEKRHRHWFAAASPQWLKSPDLAQLQEMAEDLKNYHSDVREIEYGGISNLMAYQSFDEHGTALLLIVPKEDILKDANLIEKYVHDKIDEQIVFTGIILLTIFIVIIVLSFILSRSFTINISRLAEAVARVASGDFHARVDLKTRDELGQLGKAFNGMIPALEERVHMKQSLDLAVEVQQSLFPSKTPKIEGISIAANSLYCQETGGDFYDFIDIYRNDTTGTAVVVGDVTGHGLSAALLMATSRAFLRSRLTQPGSMGQIITDINRLISEDTIETSQFVTLFYLEIDHDHKSYRWIRAGHDPAIIYDPVMDRFSNLDGKGPALGIMSDFKYEETPAVKFLSGQILLIGTDGIWETRNPEGEMYNKQRIKTIIRNNRQNSAEQILEAVTSALLHFRGNRRQDDDVTMVIIKMD